MTPRERFLATLKGLPHDRVPLHLEGFEFADLAEIEAIEDPLLRELARRIAPHNVGFCHARGFDNRDLYIPHRCCRRVREKRDAEALTISIDIDTPRGTLTKVVQQRADTRTWWTVKYPVESLADLDALAAVPWEQPPELGLPAETELPPGWRERCLTRAGVSSPFVCVAGAMSYEFFLELCATELDLIRELTADVLRRQKEVLAALLAPGRIEYVWLGGCEWLTPPMGSPALYEELVQGPEAELIELIHRGGAFAHVHCHGNVRSTLTRIADRGADLTEPVEPPPDGDITFAEAKALVGNRLALSGNIEARILDGGTPADAEQAVRAAFTGDNRRMLLRNTSCPLGTVTPAIAANYHRLMDLWEALSPLA